MMMVGTVPLNAAGDLKVESMSEELTSFRHGQGHGAVVGENLVRQQPDQLFRPLAENDELLGSARKLEFPSDEFERDPNHQSNHAGSARFEEEKEAD